jgi:signal transduction histidine kinase
MNETEPKRVNPLRIWRTVGLATVVLGIGLAVVGMIRGVQDTSALYMRLVDQAKPQARQLADSALSLFNEQVKSALRSIADDQRALGKFHPWKARDFPRWIGGIYTWSEGGLTTLQASSRHGDDLERIARRRMLNRPLQPESSVEGNPVELLYDSLEHQPIILATFRSSLGGDHSIVVIGEVRADRLRTDLVDPLLALTKGLHIVPTAPGDPVWSQPMSGPLRALSIRPTEAFLEEQRATAVWLFLTYGALMLLALGTMLGAMWFLLRSVRREMALAEMRSNFVADVSHELKTPLALIRLFGETLQSGRVRDENKQMEYYGIITRESTRLTNLINNLLDFSRIDAGRKQYTMERIEVTGVIRDTYEAYQLELDHNGFTHRLTMEPGIPEVLGDRDAIGRAILNLISNAIKYSGEERFLHIEVRRDTRRGRRGVLVSVEDHGIGIRPEDRAHLFEGFFRSADDRVRHVRGTGLGLSLVKHIVDAHQGYLDVESRLVRGSIFRIFLPAVEQPAQAPGEAPGAAEPEPGSAPEASQAPIPSGGGDLVPVSRGNSAAAGDV